MKLRVVIAEDEPLGRERLRHLLESEPLIELVAECSTGAEALNAIRGSRPDVVFLDVRMPELDGFEVIQSLGKQPSPIFVFVTAHEQFAFQAFEAEAADYLLKPFNRERLQLALRRARERLESRALRTETAPGEPGPQTLMVKTHGKLILLRVAEIDWIGACDNYLELHIGKTTHLMRGTLTGVLGQFTDGPFARMSRSTAVNVHRIKEIHRRSHGDYLVVLHNGTRLDGTRNYRAALEQIQRDAR